MAKVPVLKPPAFPVENAMNALSGSSTPKQLTLSVLCAIALALPGCAKIRMVTYPPEFTYLDSDTAQGVMHEMAASLSALDQLAQQAVNHSGDTRYPPLILDELQRIESLAMSISAGTTGRTLEGEARPSTNHLLIDEHIDDFLADIMRAKLLLETEPPNYYGTGQLTGSCNACHRLR